MAVRKIKKSWWVDFMYERERIRKRSPLNTKAGAEEYEVYLRQLVAKHGSVQAAKKFVEKANKQRLVTFAEFSERWMREYVMVNNKPTECRNKQATLRNHLIPAFGRLLLAEVTSHRIEQLKAGFLAARLTPKTINNYLMILRKCLVTAIEWDLLKELPHIRLLKSTLPPARSLDTEQVEKLVRAAPNSLWGTMILMAAKTGMRFCELSALTWENVDLSSQTVCIQYSRVLGNIGTPKNGRIRYIKLTSDVIRALQNASGIRQGFVFQREGRPIDWHAANWWLKKTCGLAGISPTSWHILRHTYASELARRGAEMLPIKDLMGHESMNMTLRYSHLNQKALAETVALLEPSANFSATCCQPEDKSSLFPDRLSENNPQSLAQ